MDFCKACIANVMLLLALQVVNAQEIFNLERAVSYALENQAEVKKAYLEMQDAKSQIKETKAIGMPKLDAYADYQRFLELPTSILPGTFQPQTEERTITDANGDNFNLVINQRDENGNIIPGPDVEAQFGTKHFFDLGLSFQMLLFEGSYVVGLQTARLYEDFAAVQKDQVEYVVKENVAKAFYNVLVVYDNLDIIDKNIQILDKSLFELTRTYEEGFIEELDVDRLKYSKSNLEIQREDLETLLAVNKNLLKLTMGFPMGEEIEVEGDIEMDVDRILALDMNQLVQDFELDDRPEYVVAKKGIDLNRMDLKRYKFQYYPSLALYASYNQQLQGNTLSEGQFFPVSLVGARLNVPIFDGLDKTAKIERVKITLAELELDLNELERSIVNEIDISKQTFDSNYRSYVLAQENMALAEKIYEVTQIKYTEGVGSSVEMRQAETDLYAAQSQYLNAQINLIQAKIDVEKALGKL